MPKKLAPLDSAQAALLEWARDNRVLRLKVSGLEVEFLQEPKPRALDEGPPDETPEQRQARIDKVMYHSTDG